MLHIILYFQVHQPYRLRPYRALHIGKSHHYFDDELNRSIIDKVSDKCYIPANSILKELIDKFEGRFKVSFSITGTLVEQLRENRPDVLESFRGLVQQGGVELLGETYYHSLSCLFDLRIGFSHPVHYSLSEGVDAIVAREEQITRIRLTGINKEKLSDVAARLRAILPPEPYKGKGIRYEGEVIRRKAGKTKAIVK